MAIDRPEESGGLHFGREDDHDLSMPALVELAQLVLGKGRAMRLLAKGTSMTPFILSGDEITLAPLSVPNRNPVVPEAAASRKARPKPRTIP